MVRTYGDRKGFQLTVEGPESPTIDHLVNDLLSAMEDRRLEIETPRVHVEGDYFERIRVSKVNGPKEIGQLASQPGPPMLELELRWYENRDELSSDIDDHVGYENAFALYGSQHVWNVEKPVRAEMEMSVTELG